MNCPSCDAELPEAGSVCPECGTALETDPTIAYVPIHDDQPLTAEEAAHVPGIRGFALVVSRGPQAGMTYVLPHGKTSVGRHPESDIFLDDITVSRRHCQFIWEDSTLLLEDSGSTNGTYVNGSRVDRANLEPGDEVLVGRFHLIVAQGDV